MKNIKNFKLLLAISLVLVLVGCEKEVPFPNRNATPLLVVNSVFSADQTSSIHISKTASLGIENPTFVSTANLVVRGDDGKQIEFLHEKDGIYKAANFTPSASTSYIITATADGAESVSASTTVPADFSYVLKDTAYGFQDGIPSWFFEIEILDQSSEENHFVIDATYSFEDPSILPHEPTGDSFLPFAHYCFDPNADNTDLLSNTEYSSAGLKAVYLSDQSFEAGSYTINLAIADRNLSKPKNGKTFASLRIRSVSQDLFNYYKSFERYRLNQGNFFAEPVQIFSNIQNGTGIFGGSLEKTELIDLIGD